MAVVPIGNPKTLLPIGDPKTLLPIGNPKALVPIGNPKAWVPYMNTKDCSQEVCSFYCPHWCFNYVIFPPPPPPPIQFPDDDSGPNFSPLVIAIIGILVSAFLLVSYYTIISKYCGNVESTRRRENHDTGEVLEDDHNPSAHEPWRTSTAGLDEALIKSITVCKYKRGDGLIDGTDCSVCLSEFQEDESLRLLPKCSHAFHVQCIDTWLRSHSNCPLCRANIIFISASPLPLPAPVTESPPGHEFLQDRQTVTSENVAAAQGSGRTSVQEMDRVQSDLGGFPKTPSRAFSDLGNAHGTRNTVIEIRDEDYEQMRRSVSMDHLCQIQLSVADVLHMNQEEDTRVEECHCSSAIAAGWSKQSAEANKLINKMRVLHCVMNPVAMKRSFSSGRFFLTRQGRVRNPSIPL